MAKSKNKEVFSVTVDGEAKEFVVVKPSAAVLQESQRTWNKAFREAVESGAMLRVKIDELLINQGIWSEEKDKQYDEMLKELKSKEAKLRSGKMKKIEGRSLAIDIRKLRLDMRELSAQKRYLVNNSAESQADNARFNYLVYACILNGDDGSRYFDSLEEYLDSESEVALVGAEKLAYLLYQLDPDDELKNVENQFLIKFGFANDKGDLINSKGDLVTEDNRVIDAEGYYLDDKGNRIDRFGNPLVEDFDVSTAEFYD